MKKQSETEVSEAEEARDETGEQLDSDEPAEDSDGDEEDSDGDEEDSDGDEEDSDGDEEDSDEEDAPAALPSDARAARVAKALGLEDGEAEETEEEAAKNRAARRRERALERRGGGRKKPAGDEDDKDDKRSGERDRNKRLREELLAKRRDAAAKREAPAAPGLAPSEMAEDVLVRTSAAVVKWLGAHKSLVGWLLFIGIVGTAGVLYYIHRSDTALATSSDALSRAVSADQGILVPEEEDNRTDEQKKDDPRKVYPSAADRSAAALEAYDGVAKEHGGSGAAILAQLGRAGVLLDQNKHDEAIETYTAVLATELAPVDPDVQARAREGLGYAKEAKGDKEGAAAEFKALEGIDGFKGLGMYHQARLLMAGEDLDGAKALLLKARELVDKENIEARKEGGEGAHRWLLKAIDDELRAIDPKAVPVSRDALSSPDATERLRQMLQDRGLPPPGAAPPMPPGGSGR